MGTSLVDWGCAVSPREQNACHGRHPDRSTRWLRSVTTGVPSRLPRETSRDYSGGALGTELEELREREEFYRAMFEVNTAIKLLIDPVDGRIVDANPAAEAFYGWPLA